MTKQNKGWRGIGRSLVVAAVGPDSLAEQMQEPEVCVVSLEGAAYDLARRRALSPDLVDAVVLEATGEDREDMLELARVLRGRYLSVVLVLPRDRWGKRVFRTHLGVFRHRGRVVRPELWMSLSVAAQQTWTLGWLRLDKRRDIQERNPAASPQAKIVDLTVAAKPAPTQAPPSRTAPWAPPPDLLVELTKAYTEDR